MICLLVENDLELADLLRFRRIADIRIVLICNLFLSQVTHSVRYRSTEFFCNVCRFTVCCLR